MEWKRFQCINHLFTSIWNRQTIYASRKCSISTSFNSCVHAVEAVLFHLLQKYVNTFSNQLFIAVAKLRFNGTVICIIPVQGQLNRRNFIFYFYTPPTILCITGMLFLLELQLSSTNMCTQTVTVYFSRYVRLCILCILFCVNISYLIWFHFISFHEKW